MEINEEALLLELETKNQQEYELNKKLSLGVVTELELEEQEEKTITEAKEINEKELEVLKQVQHLENALTVLNSDGTVRVEQTNELITSLESQKLQRERKIAQNKLNEEEINEVRLNNQATSKDQHEALLHETEAEIIETLERKIAQYSHEKMELEEILEVKNNYEPLQELSQVKDNIQQLMHDIRTYKCIEVVLKGVPSDPLKQGNSMFAELQDNCEGVKQKLKNLESQCSALETDSNDLMEKIQAAQKECENLLKEIDTINDHCDDANVDEIVAYEKEIEELDKAIEGFHEYPIDNIRIERNGLPDYAVEYAEECFKYHYWKGTMKMFNHLQRTYEEHFEISKQNRIKNFELRKLKREVLQSRVRVQNFEIENPEIVREETQVLTNADNCESKKENYSANASSRNINSTNVTIRKVSYPKITPPFRFSNNAQLLNTEETDISRLIEHDVELTRYSPLSEQKSKNDSIENEQTQVLNNGDSCESNKEHYSANSNSRNINSTNVTIRKLSNLKITPPCRFSNNAKLPNNEETYKSRLVEHDIKLTRYSPLSEQKSKNNSIENDQTQVLNNTDSCESNKENYSANVNSRNINSTKVNIRKVSNPPPCRCSNNAKLPNTEETDKSRLIEHNVELTCYSPPSEQKSKNDSIEDEETPKSSPSSDSDLQNIEERCKTDALKDYYMLTPVSPPSFYEDF